MSAGRDKSDPPLLKDLTGDAAQTEPWFQCGELPGVNFKDEASLQAWHRHHDGWEAERRSLENKLATAEQLAATQEDALGALNGRLDEAEAEHIDECAIARRAAETTAQVVAERDALRAALERIAKTPAGGLPERDDLIHIARGALRAGEKD